jgi:hypothetical protein
LLESADLARAEPASDAREIPEQSVGIGAIRLEQAIKMLEEHATPPAKGGGELLLRNPHRLGDSSLSTGSLDTLAQVLAYNFLRASSWASLASPRGCPSAERSRRTSWRATDGSRPPWWEDSREESLCIALSEGGARKAKS